METHARSRRRWLATLVLVALAVGLSACGATPDQPPRPETIADKGTPFGDLLVPKLTASVTDGAVGVTVDAPVTVSAEDGVLGAVSMTNADGSPVAGSSAPTDCGGPPPNPSATTRSTCSVRSRWVSVA